MKTIIISISAIMVVAVSVGYVRKAAQTREAAAAEEAAARNARERVDQESAAGPQQETLATNRGAAESPSPAAVPAAPAKKSAGALPAPAEPPKPDPAVINRAIDTLLATNSSYADKQTAWRQLIEAGKLDEAIAALEQKRVAEPMVADYAATLGHAYIKKCGVIHDLRDQGLLAMSADKLFDAALSLDPGNWEARFTKAVAMSYWPPNMNKGQEVIDHFQTLIQQQEVEPAQPEFAETYLWLGDQFQKMGQGENAVAIWGRGANLFPTHEGLRNRLATPSK